MHEAMTVGDSDAEPGDWGLVPHRGEYRSCTCPTVPPPLFLIGCELSVYASDAQPVWIGSPTDALAGTATSTAPADKASVVTATVTASLLR